MKLNTFILTLLVVVAGCSKDEDNTSKEAYRLSVNYDAELGNVIIEPILEHYPIGTTVQITAQPAEGYTFSHWEGITSSDANISIDMTSDIDIRAVFKTDNSTPATASDVYLSVDIQWNQHDVWTAKAQLTNRKTQQGISGAVIQINNKVLTEDDFFIGEYSDTIDMLNPGDEVTVTVKYNHEGTKTYKISAPPDFSNIPALNGSICNGLVTINWESLNCSEYVLYKKIENASGSSATFTVDDGTPLTNTTYSATVDDILNANAILSPAPKYFTLWVCPANSIRNLQGFYDGSYIRITGKKSNNVGNKPV